MAKRGRIRVMKVRKDGEFQIQATNSATAAILMQALQLHLDGRECDIEINAAWPRRAGGRPYPKLKIVRE